MGGSVEDATGDKDKPLFDIGQATERVAAAVEAARALPFPFTLTARTESFLRGNPNLDDVIKRLQAFEKAGADVLMAPGLPDLAAVRAVCAAVSKPVNFMAGIKGKSFTVAELDAAGVSRISLATSLYRSAMRGLRRRGPRGEGQGHLRLHRPLDSDTRSRRVHAGLTHGIWGRRVSAAQPKTRNFCLVLFHARAAHHARSVPVRFTVMCSCAAHDRKSVSPSGLTLRTRTWAIVPAAVVNGWPMTSHSPAASLKRSPSWSCMGNTPGRGPAARCRATTSATLIQFKIGSCGRMGGRPGV